MQKPDFNKRKISVKTATEECLNIVKNIDTKLVSAIVSVVMLLSSFGIITKYYTVAYDVYYGDVNVGVISSKEEAMRTYNKAQSDVAQCNGAYFDYDLEFVMTIAPVSAMNVNELYRGIVRAAEGEEECYSIRAEGSNVAKLRTNEEAQEALRLYTESFARADAEIYTSYNIVKTGGIITEILTVEEAVGLMKSTNLIKVTYKGEAETAVAIPFNEVIVEDETIAAGLSVVMQEGVDGKGLQKKVVFYENGEIKDDAESVVTVVEEPIDRIVHLGTGVMVGLSENSLPWPVEGTFTSEYGRRWGRNHNGIDIAAKTGTPIYAPCSGTVIFAGERSGYGNFVKIDHGEGYVTTYAHMNSISVCEGQRVSLGDQVGTVGTTGRVTGAHLHFEILLNETFVNPMNYIAG